jgi:hypothetical protein
VGLVLWRGLVVLCVMPPFEAWDEYQHVGYIEYLIENRTRPNLGQADVPASLLARLPEFPQPQSALRQLGEVGVVDYATFWSRAGRGAGPGTAASRPARIPLYQAQHGPLYYRLAARLFQAFGGLDDLRTSIGALRLANLVLTAGAVWIALGIVDRSVRDRRLAALCGLLIATQPLFLINGCRVANDALGVFLATLAIGLALTLSGKNLLVSAFGLGVLLGLAVLAKAVHLGLVPLIGAGWLTAVLGAWGESDGRRRLQLAVGSAPALLAGFAVVAHSEIHANLGRRGGGAVMQESALNRAAGRGAGDLIATARSIRWPEWSRNLWLRDSVMSGGWSWAGKHERLRSRYEAMAIAGLAGWVWIIVPGGRRRLLGLFHDPTCPLLCLVLCLSYTAALAYHAVQSQLCWGSIATNPWYAAAAYPWFLLLVCGGAMGWPVGRLGCLAPGAIALIFLATEASSVLGSMTALYAALADWNAALARLSSLQPAMFGTATLYTAIAGALLFAGISFCVVLRRVIEPSPTSEAPPGGHHLKNDGGAGARAAAAHLASPSRATGAG